MEQLNIEKSPLIIGLTGSIATGKTTLSRFLRKIGFLIFDADRVVSNLLNTHAPTLEKIYTHWPFCFEGKDRRLNKKKLAHHVFSHRADLSILESILHPQVEKCQEEFIQQFKFSPAIIMEIPLLFETEGHSLCHMVIVTTCRADIQKARVLKRIGMTEQLYDQIINRQMPDEEKKQRADLIIDTSFGWKEMVQVIRTQIQHCPFKFNM